MGTRFYHLLVFLVAVFLSVSLKLFAQPADINSKQDKYLGYRKFLEVKSNRGGHIYTGESLTEAVKKGYWSADLRFGWQTAGKTFWNKLYRYPRYGFGIYHADLRNDRILGNPTAIYSFITVPFFQPGRWNLNYDIALGVSYNFEQYNAQTNPLNDAIGSDVNMYNSFGLQAQYQLSQWLGLLFGAEWTHFSNGRTTTPNHGLNLVGVTVGFHYNYKPAYKYLNKQQSRLFLKGKTSHFPDQSSIFQPRWEWNIFAGGGRSATYEEESRRYTNVTLTLDLVHRYSPKYSFGVGVDLFYDGSLARYYPEKEILLEKKLLSGVHLLHHWHFYNFVFITQLATYLYKDTEARGKYYARAGIQYNFTERLFSQISLKTQNGAKADFLEWGIGFRIFKRSIFR